MKDMSACACSDIHTRAICDEVGERLRFWLDQSQTPVPPKLLALLLRLQLSEFASASDTKRVTRSSSAA